jgi:hypothetical protein
MTMHIKVIERHQRTTAELIALINQSREDWWPEDIQITIDRSAEHDWVALAHAEGADGPRRANFAASIGRVVAQLRFRNAWIGY